MAFLMVFCGPHRPAQRQHGKLSLGQPLKRLPKKSCTAVRTLSYQVEDAGDDHRVEQDDVLDNRSRTSELM